jgi:hypothetical protein
MKLKLATSFASVAVLLLFCGPTFAHHGTNASYDTAKRITLKGTVTEFAFSNPHLQIYFDVKDESTGKMVHWAGEVADAPFQAKRSGWTKDTLKPGDQITLVGSPSRSGSNNMVVRQVVLADGKTLSGGGGGPGVE